MKKGYVTPADKDYDGKTYRICDYAGNPLEPGRGEKLGGFVYVPTGDLDTVNPHNAIGDKEREYLTKAVQAFMEIGFVIRRVRIDTSRSMTLEADRMTASLEFNRFMFNNLRRGIWYAVRDLL